MTEVICHCALLDVSDFNFTLCHLFVSTYSGLVEYLGREGIAGRNGMKGAAKSV